MSKLDRTKKKPKQQKEVDQPASAGKPTGSPRAPASNKKKAGR